MLRDIRKLQKLEKKDDSDLLKFEQIDYIDTNGRKYPMFEMDRGAWMILVDPNTIGVNDDEEVGRNHTIEMCALH
ncbi:hypothetical protein DSCO28_30440 [Desulfosarcina ovata subsp. sediminis]|uniref:Uncharacterized protein n=1 Tax=Desulfosarcina ovata subsp. sediminis TaxID=885957 RepID=A0A5K7ZJR0_9BACT|nr:hypothetical protein DSCO28_30440 [Desulfosarcina ovata subsp. sediminis]